MRRCPEPLATHPADDVHRSFAAVCSWDVVGLSTRLRRYCTSMTCRRAGCSFLESLKAIDFLLMFYFIGE